MASISKEVKKIVLDLDSQIGKWQTKKVMVFGDVGVDEYFVGPVHRISPEAPVPVVEVDDVQKRLGLAANVALNIRSLGGIPVLFSLVGDDSGASELNSILKQNEILSDGLLVDKKRPTTRKIRVMSGQHHLVRVDFEDKSELQDEQFKKLYLLMEKEIDSCSGVIIQDYAKGVVTAKTAERVIRLAKSKKKWVIVDPYKTTSLKAYRGADFMTPNKDESLSLARQVNPHLKGGVDEVDTIGNILMEQIQSEQMVVTLGEKGMKIFQKDSSLLLPTFARKVFDVTGAGDTVISAMALGLSAGFSLEMSGVMANLAAGVVVGKIGSAPCSFDELKKEISHWKSFSA